MMLYEMSDETEVDSFLDLLQADAQLPGLLLFAGMLFFCVPVGTYLIYTINLGIEPGPSNPTQRVFSWLAAAVALFFTLLGYFYKMPIIIQAIYATKRKVRQRGRALVN